jgi:hypothetical protein
MNNKKYLLTTFLLLALHQQIAAKDVKKMFLIGGYFATESMLTVASVGGLGTAGALFFLAAGYNATEKLVHFLKQQASSNTFGVAYQLIPVKKLIPIIKELGAYFNDPSLITAQGDMLKQKVFNYLILDKGDFEKFIHQKATRCISFALLALGIGITCGAIALPLGLFGLEITREWKKRYGSRKVDKNFTKYIPEYDEKGNIKNLAVDNDGFLKLISDEIMENQNE